MLFPFGRVNVTRDPTGTSVRVLAVAFAALQRPRSGVSMPTRRMVPLVVRIVSPSMILVTRAVVVFPAVSQAELAIALLATLLSVVIGVSWGATAGYAGGRIDGLLMRFVDVLYALPGVFFVIILTVVFDQSGQAIKATVHTW